MAPEVLAASGLRRLADQLQTLSELTESLTYRLLELEEKVAGVDLQLQPLLHRQADDASLLAEDTELRLDDTEARLSRLERLLGGLESLPQGAQRWAVSQGALRNVGVDDSEELLLDPEPHFPDEDLEQSFLDEQPTFLAETENEIETAIQSETDDDHEERLIA